MYREFTVELIKCIGHKNGKYKQYHGQVHCNCYDLLFIKGFVIPFKKVIAPINPEDSRKKYRQAEQITGQGGLNIDHNGKRGESEQEEDYFTHLVRGLCVTVLRIHSV
jgi:hypothetical protein